MDLMAAIKSTIIIDGFIVSIDMTTFVLLGGTVKVAYYVKLLAFRRLPLSAVAMLNRTDDSIAFL